jgi:hypothetical protein
MVFLIFHSKKEIIPSFHGMFFFFECSKKKQKTKKKLEACLQCLLLLFFFGIRYGRHLRFLSILNRLYWQDILLK